MIIVADRLLLRPFLDSDLAALREIDGDSEVLRYRQRSQISEEMTKLFLQQAQNAAKAEPRGYFAFAVVLLGDERLIGQCGLTAIQGEQREAFLWYSFNRRFWNRGYATEAVRALLQAALGQFGFKRVIAETHPDNIASARVMQKVGMTFEGVYDMPDRDGHIRPRLRYAIC